MKNEPGTGNHGITKGRVIVQGRCPACGSRSVFVGSGGYLTCSIIACPDPVAPSKALGVEFPEKASA